MKKILLSAVVMICAVGALNAQNSKQPFIGGSFSVEHLSIDNESFTSVVINPQAGFMFNKHWGMAFDISYTYGGLTSDGWDDGGHAFGAGVSGLYMLRITDKFFYAPYARVGFSAGQASMNLGGYITDTIDMFTFSTYLSALNFEFRPNSHWAFNLGLGGVGFQVYKLYDASDVMFNLSADLVKSARIGLKYYF